MDDVNVNPSDELVNIFNEQEAKIASQLLENLNLELNCFFLKNLEFPVSEKIKISYHTLMWIFATNHLTIVDHTSNDIYMSNCDMTLKNLESIMKNLYDKCDIKDPALLDSIEKIMYDLDEEKVKQE